jgi:hypothetical protein
MHPHRLLCRALHCNAACAFSNTLTTRATNPLLLVLYTLSSTQPKGKGTQCLLVNAIITCFSIMSIAHTTVHTPLQRNTALTITHCRAVTKHNERCLPYVCSLLVSPPQITPLLTAQVPHASLPFPLRASSPDGHINEGSPPSPHTSDKRAGRACAHNSTLYRREQLNAA